MEQKKENKSRKVKIEVDTSDLDKAIKKIEKLNELLKEANQLSDQLKKGLEIDIMENPNNCQECENIEKISMELAEKLNNIAISM